MEELYGYFDALIISRRQYDHLTKPVPGKRVRFQRETGGSKDRVIAVAVVNGQLQRLGHLSRWLARLLAPCIDMVGCRFVGTVVGAGNRYTTPIKVELFAHTNVALRVCKMLGRYWHMWQLRTPATRELEYWAGSQADSDCSSSETDAGHTIYHSLNQDASSVFDY
ncbi:hypothetical protein GGI05_006064, partial [Coemansia sp. RSA 2603]